MNDNLQHKRLVAGECKIHGTINPSLIFPFKMEEKIIGEGAPDPVHIFCPYCLHDFLFETIGTCKPVFEEIGNAPQPKNGRIILPPSGLIHP